MRLRSFAWLTLLCSLLSGAALAADALHFDSDGINIRYFSGGQGEALILLHGFSGSAETAWIRSGVFDALVDAGFHVIAIDHRGHGGSDKPHDPASYGVNMAEDVRRLLDHLGLERAHVVGYSMAAKIANTFRARHPQRVVTLTLGGYGWPWRGQAVTLEESRENLAQRTFGPGNDVEALAPYRVVSNDLVPSEQNLRGNSIPTLSIVGTEDTVISSDNLNTLRATMAHVEAVDMPGTHAGPDGALYKPEFGDEVIFFIRRNSN
jgi:pimeloyl-ACP methyl ester carboxylesterase